VAQLQQEKLNVLPSPALGFQYATLMQRQKTVNPDTGQGRRIERHIF